MVNEELPVVLVQQRVGPVRILPHESVNLGELRTHPTLVAEVNVTLRRVPHRADAALALVNHPLAESRLLVPVGGLLLT